jgi:Protein of unknown function (DUF2786)
VSDTQSIISRIIKLRQMTEANGCTENEAEVAMAKLAMLMAEHNISESVLGHYETQKDYCTKAARFYNGSSQWTVVNRGIETLFSVRIWSDFEIIGPASYRVCLCYGTPVDVEAALTMIEICYNAIASATLAWAKTALKGRRRGGTFYENAVMSFQYGMGLRLKERIDELREKSPGQSLVAARKAQVWEAWEKAYPGVHHGQIVLVNNELMARGRQAAEGIRLGFARELGQSKRIGHSQ